MNTYTIRDAAKLIEVETHVLRYWEEELGLNIKRNELGHRYYDDRDIQIFQEVKQLKAKGMMLKDIRQGIDRARKYANENKNEEINSDTSTGNRTNSNYDKRNNKEYVNCSNKNKDNNNEDDRDINEYTSNNEDDDGVVIELSKVMAYKKEQMRPTLRQMQNTMNQLLANAFMENKPIIAEALKEEISVDIIKQIDEKIKEQEEKAADRYKQLDESIRALQRKNEEIAASKTRRHLFKRRHIGC